MKGTGLSMTLENCQLDITNNAEELSKFIKFIITLINMKPLGDIVIRHGSDELPGISVVQLIETSHIALHGFSNSASYMFNIESCKSFDSKNLKDFLIEYFNPSKVTINAEYEIELK